MRRCVSLSGADMDPTIIAGGLKLLGGLFGKKKTMSPQQSIMSTAAGARQAAKAYGFNALTLLAGSNATAGAGMDMGAPPLASLAVLGDIIEDNYGDEAKTRKEHNRLQNELLTLEVDRARSLNAVAPEASVAGGGALTGGRVQTRISGPATAFLKESDRNPALADERDNTVSYQSHGQEMKVPVGPDIDEVLTGAYIENVNKNKAEKARMSMGPMTVGTPVDIPQKPVGGLGGTVWVDDPALLLPPPVEVVKPKPNPKRKDLPLRSWEQKYSF